MPEDIGPHYPYKRQFAIPKIGHLDCLINVVQAHDAEAGDHTKPTPSLPPRSEQPEEQRKGRDALWPECWLRVQPYRPSLVPTNIVATGLKATVINTGIPLEIPP